MSARSGENQPAPRSGAVPYRPADGCRCRISILSSPRGDVVLVDVCGELDALTVPGVRCTLDDVLGLPVVHVVVGLAGLRFCSVGGLELFVDARAVAARRGVGLSVGGASRQVSRFWSVLWAADRLPRQFPDVDRAMDDALAPWPVLRLVGAGDPATGR